MRHRRSLCNAMVCGKPHYRGVITPDGIRHVWKESIELLPDRSLEVRRHSPAGFTWGFCGSGPAQCALAILLDLTGEVDIARLWYQQFKREVIALLPQDNGWALPTEHIWRWIHRKIAQRLARIDVILDAYDATHEGLDFEDINRLLENDKWA